MSYWIIHSNNWKLLYKANGNTAVFETERAAKAYRSRRVDAGDIVADSWFVKTFEEYCLEEPLVAVKALMTGKEVHIRASQRGTPSDPSMEMYYTF